MTQDEILVLRRQLSRNLMLFSWVLVNTLFVMVWLLEGQAAVFRMAPPDFSIWTESLLGQALAYPSQLWTGTTLERPSGIDFALNGLVWGNCVYWPIYLGLRWWRSGKATPGLKTLADPRA